jgi:hypothetical protein
MLDEDAYFRGQPAASRSNRKDWHRSFKGSQKAYHSTFSEFCGEEPCWRLGNPQMFKDTHPHLFNIAGSKGSCGDNTLCVLARAKAPRLYRTPLDENDTSKAVEIVPFCISFFMPRPGFHRAFLEFSVYAAMFGLRVGCLCLGVLDAYRPICCSPEHVGNIVNLLANLRVVTTTGACAGKTDGFPAPQSQYSVDRFPALLLRCSNGQGPAIPPRAVDGPRNRIRLPTATKNPRELDGISTG